MIKEGKQLESCPSSRWCRFAFRVWIAYESVGTVTQGSVDLHFATSSLRANIFEENAGIFAYVLGYIAKFVNFAVVIYQAFCIVDFVDCKTNQSMFGLRFGRLTYGRGSGLSLSWCWRRWTAFLIAADIQHVVAAAAAVNRWRLGLIDVIFLIVEARHG